MAPLQRQSIIIIDDNDGSFAISDEISNISHSYKRKQVFLQSFSIEPF